MDQEITFVLLFIEWRFIGGVGETEEFYYRLWVKYLGYTEIGNALEVLGL